MTIPNDRSAQTIFLLSPAHCGGRRAQLLLRSEATFTLANRLRASPVPIGEVFSFLSGLYFRGKIAYAGAFARTTIATEGTLVITPGRGLLPAATPITLGDLLAIAATGVSPDNPAFREPLERDACALAAALAGADQVVLLGSIATGKYVDVLEHCLDGRLKFPAAFVGRGDMSRGGLMLRSAASGSELAYVPIAGAVRHGPRPAKLAPVR